VKALWRLCRYVRLFKKDAFLSFVMAITVALLQLAAIPCLYPLFNGLFKSPEDAEKMRHWPAKVAAHFPALEEPTARLVQYMFDHRVEAMLWALGIVMLLSIIKGFAMFTQEYAAGKVHTGVSRLLAEDLYRHVLRLSMSFYHRVGSPSVTSRFTNDVEAVRQGMAFLFNKALLEPIRLVGCFVLAAYFSWTLLLFNIAIFPVLAIGVRYLGQKAKKATRKGLHSRDKLLNILQETFEGISIVKAFNMESREEDRFADENTNVRAQDLKVVKAAAIASPFIEVTAILGLALSMGFAVWMLDTGRLTLNVFGLFYVALVSMSDPMRKLSNLNTRLQSLVAAATRVFEFFDEEPDIVDKPDAKIMPAFSRGICLSDVCFSYNGSDTVLKSVNITARKGEIIALVGPSGAGKSTVARLIPRFYDTASGVVKIDDVDVRDYTLASLRDQIGLVTQDIILFNDTIAANIAYGRPDATQEQIEKAAHAANAHDFIMCLPNGYNSVIGEKGLTLSGGQRQRVALARAIIKDPPILILDEATSSLDSESEHLIQLALDEFMKHRTSIVIAHRLSTVEKASRIYVLAEGCVTAAGTNDELLRSSDIYKRLYSRQFRLNGV